MSMTGAIGIDVQASRTALALLEASAYGVSSAPVGDGQRLLIPHAYTGQAWGSRAAESVLAESVSGEVDLVGLLFCWQRSPWDEGFLRGIRARLDDYTGRTPLNPRTYQLALCADPDSIDPSVLGRCESAGMNGVQLVSPADALVSRWMSETPAALPRSAVILAVACGEAATSMRCYVADHSGNSPVLRGGNHGSFGMGSGCWTAALAREVLSRCRPGVPAAALLALLDGAGEFGAALRARGAGEVQWAGPLSEYLFAPLRTTAGELAARSDVADFTRVIRTEAERLLSAQGAGRRPAAILVGGPGAVWPFAGTALAGLGPVWQSLEPELDLAVGACWWTQLRRAFGGLLSGTLRLPSAEPLPADWTQLPPATKTGTAEQDTGSTGELLPADGADLTAAAEGTAAAGPAGQPGLLSADWTDLTVTPETSAAEDYAGIAEQLGDTEQYPGDADETFVEDIMRNIRTKPETPWER